MRARRLRQGARRWRTKRSASLERAGWADQWPDDCSTPAIPCRFSTRRRKPPSRWSRAARDLPNRPPRSPRSADIVLASLPTPDIVKAVALGPDGLIAGNRARIIIDLSTTGPGAAKLIAEGLKPRDMTLVDAPVSGGITGAVNGTLAVMVSCPKDDLRAGRADPEELRQAVLHRRQARHGADRQARQQPDGGGRASRSPPKRWRWASRAASTPRC